MNADSKAEDFGSMSLSELFDASDRIGDKYLTEAERQQRERELAEALSELDKTVDSIESQDVAEESKCEAYEESKCEAYEDAEATKLKRWESPRSDRARNRRGRGGAARSRQRQKQFRALAARLK